MSEASLEYNLGIVGYGDIADLRLIAYQDGRAYLGIIFSSPENKRFKPLVILLTDFTFSEFYKLLMDAEAQVNKLLTANKITGLNLPRSSQTKFRSNLGSVNFNASELSVSIVATSDNTAHLQLYADDAKRKSNGFSVAFDDVEFNKLKTIVTEAFKTIIKTEAEQPEKEITNYQVRDQKFVNISENGNVSLDVKNSAEAQIALKEIALIKKEISVHKRDIDEKIRQMRADHASKIQQQGSKFRGGGWFGKIFRTYQTVERESQKHNLLLSIEPLEVKKDITKRLCRL